MSPITAPRVSLPGPLRYQVLSGSQAYGLAGPNSDQDWRGVFQLPTEAFLGLRAPIETVELPPDQTYWELRHFAKLCLAGNPNIMELLWLDRRYVAVTSPVAEELRKMRTHFFSRSMADAYLGWAKGERLNMAPELVKMLGVSKLRPASPADWKVERLAGKQGSHLVRLLLGFRSALRTGALNVTLHGAEQQLVLAIKAGQVPAAEVLKRVIALENECRALDAKLAWKPADPQPLEQLLLRARRGELG